MTHGGKYNFELNSVNNYLLDTLVEMWRRFYVLKLYIKSSIHYGHLDNVIPKIKEVFEIVNGPTIDYREWQQVDDHDPTVPLIYDNQLGPGFMSDPTTTKYVMDQERINSNLYGTLPAAQAAAAAPAAPAAVAAPAPSQAAPALSPAAAPGAAASAAAAPGPLAAQAAAAAAAAAPPAATAAMQGIVSFLPGDNGTDVPPKYLVDPPPDEWVVCENCNWDEFKVDDRIVLRKYAPQVPAASTLQDFKTAFPLINKFATISKSEDPDITLDYGSLAQPMTIYPPNWEILKYTPTNTT